MRTAEAGNDAGQFDHFPGVGKVAWHIEESRAETERAVQHGLFRQSAHRIYLDGIRRPVLLSEDSCADGPVADEQPDVDGRPQRIEPGQEGRHGQRRAAVGPFHNGRNPLPDIIVCRRQPEEASPCVGVHINESGCHHQTCGINLLQGIDLQVLSDGHDPVPSDGHVADPRCVSGSVHNASAPDDEVNRGGRFTGAPAQEDERTHYEKTPDHEADRSRTVCTRALTLASVEPSRSLARLVSVLRRVAPDWPSACFREARTDATRDEDRPPARSS